MNTHNTNRRPGFTLVELLIVLVIMALFAVLVGGCGAKLLGAKGMHYSDGQRTGVNYKISQKGWIWTTYEGELSLQLMTRNSDGMMINQIFQYSVSDPEVAKKIETLSASGAPITLKYKEYKFRGFKYGSTNYDVIDVTSGTSSGPPAAEEQ